MEPEEKYRLNIQGWDRLASQYQQRFMDLDIYNKSYALFCKLVEKKDALILEIGCGPGNICKYMRSIRRDFHFLETDVSPEMIKLSEKNNPHQEFLLLDAREIKRLNRKFDGIICGFCVPYLNKEDVANLLNHSHAMLNPNGILYLSAIEGDYQNSGEQSSSDGKCRLFVHYYEAEFLLKLLSDQQFAIINVEKIRYRRNESETETHLIIQAKK